MQKLPKLPRFWFFAGLKMPGSLFMVFYIRINDQSKRGPASNSKLRVNSNHKTIPVRRGKSWEIDEVNET